MKEIKTATRLYAPVEQIWSTLTNFEAYSEWNTAVGNIKGDLRQHQPFKLQLNPAPVAPSRMQSRLDVIEENKKLVWNSTHIGFQQLFGVQYYFILIPKKHGRVKFIHGAIFWGLLLPLSWPQIASENKNRLKETNENLKLILAEHQFDEQQQHVA